MGSPPKTSFSNSANPKPNSETIDFIEQVRVNPEELTTALKPRYDLIVCGSGSSGFARTITISTAEIIWPI